MDMNKIRGLHDKVTRIKQHKAAKEKELTEREKFSAAVKMIAARPEGVTFFKQLAIDCGFDIGSSTITKGELNPITTVYYDARRSVYLELRKLIDTKDLINIEMKE